MDMFSEKISPGKNLLVGFQHVLAMCPGTIAVPLIMGGAMPGPLRFWYQPTFLPAELPF